MSEQVLKPKRTVREQATVPSKPRANGPIAWVTSLLTFVGEAATLAYRALMEIAHGGLNVSDLLNQMSAIGADSVWIVLTITTATGAVFAFYVTKLSLQVGFTQLVGGSLGYGFLNELGPALGGVALAARSGAAIAAEIGSMVVTEQVDALRAMAVSPVRYLVVPRVLAATIMMPLLTVMADVAGLFGGYFFAVAAGVPANSFWTSVEQFVEVHDFTRGLEKAIVYGFVVGLVACQQGLRTKGGATGVGRATTSSVVVCIVLIFLLDLVLTQLLTDL